jgi:hypothetical protein
MGVILPRRGKDNRILYIYTKQDKEKPNGAAEWAFAHAVRHIVRKAVLLL